MNIEVQKEIKPFTAAAAEPAGFPRLYSLDALRGFDMIWIMGVGTVVYGLSAATGSPFWNGAAAQLTHVPWHGFSLYDLIFPLFLFLSGVATPYSLTRDLDRGIKRSVLLGKVVRRGMILVVLGFIYNNGVQLFPLSEMRYVSVLSRIGIGYMFANIIYLYSKKTTQVLWFAGLLIGYWLLLKFNAAPGFAPGDLSMEGNFGSFVDRSILPGRLSKGIHDTTGFIFNIPAISTGLLGIFAGELLKNGLQGQRTKALILAGAGVLSLLLAQLWDLDFPINKNLWSSSFVLHTGGLSLLLLAAFYYVIDVLGYRRWAFVFKVIGMNSILIYISWRFIDWGYTTEALFGWLGALTAAPFTAIVLGVCAIVIKWFFLYFLYKKKIFLKV